jgi:ectoine hydroxylase-related dioxygenase (phytanoyl-CoA dioxygenase family)
MRPEEILAAPPRVLSQEQRERYFRDGFVVAEGLVGRDWLERLNACSDRLLQASRAVPKSNEAYDLGPGHSAERPHVRRLRAAVDRDPLLWEFAADHPMADIAADLVGPDVKFHSSKINYKWPGAGEVVKWHQDIQAWPHTNYSPVTLGVYLDDVAPDQGPLACLAGSHEGRLYVHTDADGKWRGAVADDDLAALDLEAAVPATGPAGTLVAINCRTLHASRANLTARVRPMLLYVYSSADAFAWMPPPTPTRHTGEIVRGEPARFAHVDPRPCPVPPDWSKQGYGSIFVAQGTGAAPAQDMM